MTGASIDASLRGTALPEQAQGVEVPDSKTNLAATPQLIMVPGVSRPVFKFEDGAGLTDAFGNIYDGYGGSGGSSFVFRHTSSSSMGDEIDTAGEGQFPVFDGVLSQYKPKTWSDFMAWLIEAPQDKTYPMIQSMPYEITIISTAFNFTTGSGSVTFPSSPITVGSPVDIVVSGTAGSPTDLQLIIEFERNLINLSDTPP